MQWGRLCCRGNFLNEHKGLGKASTFLCRVVDLYGLVAIALPARFIEFNSLSQSRPKSASLWSTLFSFANRKVIACPPAQAGMNNRSCAKESRLLKES